MVLRSTADTGIASYYGDAFHGKKTSSGETFNMHARTCAHRWLPFNTKLLVTNLSNGRQVVVRVTDRGPWKSTRMIDLSKQAAIDLDMIRAGTARISIHVVDSAVEEADDIDETDSR
ncbi:MAG: septal ring lytic transglycosylase RlpA family protein [Candidatus Kapabacteria bacterium]|nr:septal ring lytic transglycosylase RlpA family protein [Candidatus Kapabacteria bacterium]